MLFLIMTLTTLHLKILSIISIIKFLVVTDISTDISTDITIKFEIFKNGRWQVTFSMKRNNLKTELVENVL